MLASADRPSVRRGYTLLEMIVVMAVLATLVAISWPSLRAPLRKSQLRDAAKQVRIELAKTRLKAIESGVAQQFRFQRGANRFDVAPKPPPDNGETFSPKLRDRFAAKSETTQTSSRNGLPDDEVTRHKLPDGISFVSPETDDLSSKDLQRNDASDHRLDEEAWSKPIVFYPNGRTSNAKIPLRGRRDYRIDVTVRGLTGAVSVGKLQRGDVQQ